MAWDHSGNPRQSYRSAGTACGRRAPAETLARVEVSANDPQTDTTNVAGGVTRSPLGKESWTNPPGRGPGLMHGRATRGRTGFRVFTGPIYFRTGHFLGRPYPGMPVMCLHGPDADASWA